MSPDPTDTTPHPTANVTESHLLAEHLYQAHQTGTALTAIRDLHTLVEVAVCRITDDGQP